MIDKIFSRLKEPSTYAAFAVICLAAAVSADQLAPATQYFRGSMALMAVWMAVVSIFLPEQSQAD